MSIYSTTALERYQPVLSDVERMTLLGFLAYLGHTATPTPWISVRFTAGCWQHHLHPFEVRSVDRRALFAVVRFVASAVDGCASGRGRLMGAAGHLIADATRANGLARIRLGRGSARGVAGAAAIIIGAVIAGTPASAAATKAPAGWTSRSP